AVVRFRRRSLAANIRGCCRMSPPPWANDRAAGSVVVLRSRHADEIDHRGFVGVRREADGGGAGGGEGLGDLARETKVHGGERALETAHARGAIEISLRAAA